MDDTSSSSCFAETMTSTIKREAHTPTTDQSEDSGVDVSAAAATTHSNDGRKPYKRKRSDDEYDDGDGYPNSAKANRTSCTDVRATATMLSVNMALLADRKTTAASVVAGCTPFRPWSSAEESSSDVGLRLFHDIRNVDRILTLTQRRGEPPPPPPPQQAPSEPQPLDLTKGRIRQYVSVADGDRVGNTAEYGNAADTESTPANEPGVSTIKCSADSSLQTVAMTTCAAVAATATAVVSTTRYSKNMSRARRIEANARERSRVHTISAAFDTLRTVIPSYSRNQKLSKLSTIRIASAYILTMSRLLDMDYSAEQDRPSVDECVDNITGIIHMEGKARKRKDE